jgi:hypothetical protein
MRQLRSAHRKGDIEDINHAVLELLTAPSRLLQIKRGGKRGQRRLTKTLRAHLSDLRQPRRFRDSGGRDDDHDVIHPNLKYEQYRWDDRLLYYYIDDQGQWVLRTNKTYIYPTGVSSSN